MQKRAQIRLWWATGALLCLGSLAAAQTDPAQARKTRDRYEEILLKNPQPGTAFDRLYQNYSDAGELDAWAARLADKAKAASTPQEAARYHLITGYLYQRRSHDAPALAAFDQAIQADAANPRAFAARGLLLAKTGKHLPAAESLAKAIALNPPRQELQSLYKALGRAYASAGQGENAVKAWLTLADLFPDDTTMREELAGRLIQEGRLPEASVQYEKLRAATQDAYQKVRAVFALAQLATAQNKPEQAITLLSDQLASLAPESWLRAETHRRLEITFSRSAGLPALADFYARWITAHPADIDVRLARASLLRRINQPEQALQAAREALAVAPDKAEVRTALADMLLEQNQRAEAIALLEKIASSQPTDPASWERLGNVHISDPAKSPDQQKQAALSAWKNIFEKAPQPDPARALKTAELLRKAGLPDAALEYYGKAGALAPEQTEYDEYAGLYLAELGRRSQAVARLQKTVEGPRNTLANRLRLAQLLIQLKALPEALAALGEPIETPGPDAYAVESLRATLLTSLRRSAQALAAIDRLEQKLADTPERAREARIARADYHKTQGTLAQAAQELGDKIKAAPSPDPDALEMLALYQRAQGLLPQAADTAAQAARIDPSSPARLALATDLSIENNDFTRAFTQAGLLLERQPQRRAVYAQSLTDLASRSQGSYPHAAARAKNLITLIPDAPQPYLLLSTLQTQQADFSGALATLRQGVRHCPSDVPLLLALARRQAATGAHEEACETYQRALDASTDPEQKTLAIVELTRRHISAGTINDYLQKLADKARDTDFEPAPAFALATAAREAGKLDKAQAALEESLLRRPSDAQTLQSLIQITRARGLREQAIQYADQLRKLRPDDPQLTQTIAQLLLEVGRPQQAVALLQSAPVAPGSAAPQSPPEVALQHARALVQEGSNAQAVQVLTQAAKVFPADWRLIMEAARITQDTGRPEKAAEFFDQIIRLPVPPGTPNDLQAQFPNVSYLGFKGRAPALNRWINLRPIQTRCVTEINFTTGPGAIPPGAGANRMVSSVVRYNPPDLPSAQLAALIHRLHLAQVIGDLNAYLAQVASEAGYRLPAMPADAPLAAPSRPARVRLLQALLLLNLTEQAQSAAKAFYAQDPAFSEAAVLDAALTLSQSLSAHNLMLGNPRDEPASPDAAENAQATADAIALVERAAPEALSDLAMLLAESALARGAKSHAAQWIDLAFKTPTSLQTRLSLLGMLVRANDTVRASRLLESMLPDAATLAASPKNANLAPFLDEFTTIAGQALRRQTAALGIDLCMASLQTIAAGEGGRVWLQGQPGQPTFNLQLFPAPGVAPSSSLLGGEFANTLQQWCEQAAQQPSMKSAFATRALQWSLNAPPNHKAFAAVAASTILRHANLPDDALAVLQDAAKPAPAGTPEIPNIVEVRLCLLHLLIAQRKIDQAKPLLATLAVSRSADPALELGRQLTLARFYIAVAQRDLTEIKQLIPELDTPQNTLQDAHSLTRLRATYGLSVPAPQAPASPPISSATTAPARVPLSQTVAMPPQTDAQALAVLIQNGNAQAAELLATRILAQTARAVLVSAQEPHETNFALAALARANRFDAALAAAESAWQSQNDDPEICARYLLLLNAKGDAARAETVLAKLIASSSAHISARYEYAIFLHSQGRFAEAAAQYDHVLARRPGLIMSGLEVMECYKASNRLPDLVKRLVTIPRIERLTILHHQAQSLAWILDIARSPVLAPKDALAIVEHYRIIADDAPDPALSIDLLQLALATGEAPAIIKQTLARLESPSSTESVPQPGGRHAPFSPLRLFEAHDNAPPPALAAVDAVAKAGQLDALDKAVASHPSAAPAHIAALRAIIAAKRAPADMTPVRAFVASANNGAPAAALAQALPSDQLALAHQLAAAALKDTAPRSRLRDLDTLPLLDISARHALSENKPQDAAAFYTRLLTPPTPRQPIEHPTANTPPWAQAVNAHGALLLARLAYLPAAAKLSESPQLADAAVDLLIAAQSVAAVVPDERIAASLQAALPAPDQYPHLKTALETRIARLEAFKTSSDAAAVPKTLLWLFLLSDKIEKAAEILPQAFPTAGFTIRDHAYACTLIARRLALAGKPAQARAVLFHLIKLRRPAAMGPLTNQRYPGAFSDAASIKELAAALHAVPAKLRLNTRTGDYLPLTLAGLIASIDKMPDPKERAAAHDAALLALFAASQWPALETGPLPDSPVAFSGPSLPTLVLRQFVTLGKQAEAYPWYRDVVFPSMETNTLPAPDLFILDSASSCPLADFVSLAVQTQNAENLTQTVQPLAADDSLQGLVARRTLLLLALQQNKTDQARDLLAKSVPHVVTYTELPFDPSLGIIILTALSNKDLAPLALDLYLQSAQVAFVTEPGRLQAQDLYPRILARLAQLNRTDLIEPFKQRVEQSTFITRVPTGR